MFCYSFKRFLVISCCSLGCGCSLNNLLLLFGTWTPIGQCFGALLHAVAQWSMFFCSLVRDCHWSMLCCSLERVGTLFNFQYLSRHFCWLLNVLLLFWMCCLMDNVMLLYGRCCSLINFLLSAFWSKLCCSFELRCSLFYGLFCWLFFMCFLIGPSFAMFGTGFAHWLSFFRLQTWLLIGQFSAVRK